MGTLCIILGVALILAALAIFGLWRVLKNTCIILKQMLTLDEIDKALKSDEAYDGKYYPGHALVTLKYGYDCEGDMCIADFSQYEDKGLIAIWIMTSEPFPEALYESQGITRQEAERPHLFPNVTVFQPMEGFWKWK